MRIEQRRAGHDKTGSAKAALLRIVVDERRLDRAQSVGRAKSFDRRDFAPHDVDRKRSARVDWPTVFENGARTASCAVTNLFGTRYIKPITERIEQSCPRLHGHLSLRAIDTQTDADLARADWRAGLSGQRLVNQYSGRCKTTCDRRGN
jgi:hypothetical protein